jgi:hypothetical protein
MEIKPNFWKFLIVLLTGIVFLFPSKEAGAASLMELLMGVKATISQWETDGRAVDYPYAYTKMLKYYTYGKLYASYALDEMAIDMLKVALCTSAPVDCKPYKYFLLNLGLKNYYTLRREQPILLANTEAAYDAYASWWIGIFESKTNPFRSADYTDYSSLEGLVKEDFITYWVDFWKNAPRPVLFVIDYPLRDNDVFLLHALNYALENGLIKKVVFYVKSPYMVAQWKQYYPLLYQKATFVERNSSPIYIEVY